MLPEIRRYLSSISFNSRLDPYADSDVVRELQTHFEDEIEELCGAGLSEEEAANEAASRFGSAIDIGRQLYEVYSKGTWIQALLAGLPHVLIALTFALHLWRLSYWLVGVSVFITGITVYAWYRGKPGWFYSWLGYFSMVALAVAFLVIFVIERVLAPVVLGSNALWIVIVVYVGLAICLMGYIVIRVVRQDWLYASLMLIPFPVLFVWLVALEREVGLIEYTRQGLPGSDMEVAVTFAALSAITATFIRFRRRLMKSGVLSIGMMLTLAAIWRFTESSFHPVICFLLALFLTILIMSPAVLQRRVKPESAEVEAPDNSLPERVWERR